MKQLADATGLFEFHIRRIVDGLDEPSDTATLLIWSTLENLSIQKASTKRPKESA